ncbi:MAG: SEL1-like repeat protein [Oxalobacter sp.]|nr:SEL1-like repeat protein [Oxalobacter sp.]
MSQQTDSVEQLVWQASSGDVEAQYALGIALLEGTGVDANLEKAVEWLKVAAAGGHVKAATLLETFG